MVVQKITLIIKMPPKQLKRRLEDFYNEYDAKIRFLRQKPFENESEYDINFIVAV